MNTHTHLCVHTIHTCSWGYLPHVHTYSPSDIPPQTAQSRQSPHYRLAHPTPSEHPPVVHSPKSLHTYIKFPHMAPCCVSPQNPIYPPSKRVDVCAPHTYVCSHMHLPCLYVLLCTLSMLVFTCCLCVVLGIKFRTLHAVKHSMPPLYLIVQVLAQRAFLPSHQVTTGRYGQ